MLWLKCIPVVLTALLVIYEQSVVLRTPPKKGKKAPRGVPIAKIVGALVFAVITCVIIVLDDKTANEATARAKNAEAREAMWKTNTTMSLTKLEALGSEGEAVDRYLAIMRDASARLNSATAPVASYLTNEPLRSSARTETENANQNLARKQKVRVQPVADYVVARFDVWMADLRKAGKPVEGVETNALPAVRRSFEDPGGRILRKGFFKNKRTIYVKLSAAVIADGAVKEPFLIEIMTEMPGATGDIWGVLVAPERYEVRKYGDRFTYAPYHGTSVNPMDDATFLEAVQKSFDEAMTFAVDEALR